MGVYSPLREKSLCGLNRMGELWNEVAGNVEKKDDRRGAFNAEELSKLMAICGCEADGFAAIDAIESAQGIQKYGNDGEKRVLFAQWAKYMNDVVREKTTGSTATGNSGFKFPWQ